MFVRPMWGAEPPTPSLLTGLVAYWEMEEGSSANRIDTIGGLILAQFGNPTQDTSGIAGNCARFNSSDRLKLDPAVAATQITGDKTYAAWYRHQAVPAGGTAGTIFGVDNTTSQREYGLLRVASSNYFEFDVWNTVGTSHSLFNFRSIVDATWYFLVCGFDDTANEIFFSINGETMATKAFVGTPETTTGASFDVGNSDPTSSRWLSGCVDELGIWDRVLNDADIQWLYNGHTGRAFSELV